MAFHTYLLKDSGSLSLPSSRSLSILILCGNFGALTEIVRYSGKVDAKAVVKVYLKALVKHVKAKFAYNSLEPSTVPPDY